MKHWSKNRVKRFAGRALALIFCLATLLPLAIHDASAFDSAEVISQVKRGTLYLFKWTPLMDGDKARSGPNYVTLLNEKNKTIRGTNQVISGPDEAQIEVHSNYTPFSYGDRSSGDVFYTLGSMGAPIINRERDDGDNNGYEHSYWLADEDYPYAPRQAISRNGDGDWDEFADYYFKDLTGNSAYNTWIDDYLYDQDMLANMSEEQMLAYQRKASLSAYSSDVSFFTLCKANSKGKFMIFKNISNKYDPGWQCYKNGRIWCDQEGDSEDLCWFNVWYGNPTVYSMLQQSYVIRDGQTLTFDSEYESYRGIYIPPTVTLKVEKGGTLAINETVYNDGTILCDGGTVIIQSKGSLSPLSSDDSGTYNTKGKNKIIVQNGGNLIIMPEGKLYTTIAYPMTLIESRLINFGNYVMGGDLEVYSSFVENRQGGKIVCGYNYQGNRDDLRACFENETVSDNGCTGMYYTHDSKIYLFDTKEHYDTYGWLSQASNPTNNFVLNNASLSKTLLSAANLKSKINDAIHANAANLSDTKYTMFTT